MADQCQRGIESMGYTKITAKWKVLGEPGTYTRESWNKSIKKPAIRFYDDALGECASSTALTYGTGGDISVAVHFRLEDCYGGDALNRVICQKYNWGTSKGWVVYYNVASTELRVQVSDGTHVIEATMDYDVDKLEWVIFTFHPGGATGLNLYRGTTLMDTQNVSTVGDVNTNSQLLMSDTTYEIAMLFGGFALFRGILTADEIEDINTMKDSAWVPLLTAVREVHIPGEQYEWSGVYDISRGTSTWKDVAGGNHHLTISGTKGMASTNQIIRPVHTFEGKLNTLSYTRNGSYCELNVSADEDITVGETIHLKTRYREWLGTVEKITMGTGEQLIRAIGYDEDTGVPIRNTRFSDRSVFQLGEGQDSTNLIVEGTENTDAGSSYTEMNNKLSLIQDSAVQGIGYAEGIGSMEFLDETPIEMVGGDFQILARGKSQKDSASTVQVDGFGNADIPIEETFSSNGSTFNLSYKPVSILSVTIGAVEQYSGYHIDADAQELLFDVAPGDEVVIKYTHRDVESVEVSDVDIEHDIGGKKKIRVWMGWITSTPLAAIAAQLLRRSYLTTTIRPSAKRFYNKIWYLGQKIHLNVTSDTFKTNGYFFITRITYEGHLLLSPKLEMEEYNYGDGTVLPPWGGQFGDMTESVKNIADGTRESKRGFHSIIPV